MIMTPKVKLIKRLNEQFGWNIPSNIRIKSHQKKFSDCGSYSWVFASYQEKLFHWNSYGSTLTITELLKYQRYELHQLSALMYEITPEGY